MARYSPEEVIPLAGIQAPSLVALISATYQAQLNQNPFAFQTPESTAGPILIPALVFTNGQYALNNKVISVAQIAIVNNGITIISNNTDSSDEIMRHFFTLLNNQLGFRFSDLERKYFSSVVVQFDKNIDDAIKQLADIREIVEKSLGKKPHELSLSRLAFGPETRVPIVAVNVETIDKFDFSIERRRGQPFSARRYFSSAALTTKDHLATLEKIEQVFLDG